MKSPGPALGGRDIWVGIASSENYLLSRAVSAVVILAGRNSLVELVLLNTGASEQDVEIASLDDQERGAVGLSGSTKVPVYLDPSERDNIILIEQPDGGPWATGAHLDSEIALHVDVHEVLKRVHFQQRAPMQHAPALGPGDCNFGYPGTPVVEHAIGAWGRVGGITDGFVDGSRLSAGGWRFVSSF